VKETAEIAAARIEAERARAQLLETFRALERPLLDLQQMLTPNHMMGEVWDSAKEKGASLAEEAVDAVRARPLAVTGVVAAIAMFLAREPLMGLAGKVVGGANDKRKARKTRRQKTKQDDTEIVA
jgi:hypothetical protein